MGWTSSGPGCGGGRPRHPRAPPPPADAPGGPARVAVEVGWELVFRGYKMDTSCSPALSRSRRYLCPPGSPPGCELGGLTPSVCPAAANPGPWGTGWGAVGVRGERPMCLCSILLCSAPFYPFFRNTLSHHSSGEVGYPIRWGAHSRHLLGLQVSLKRPLC